MLTFHIFIDLVEYNKIYYDLYSTQFLQHGYMDRLCSS